MKQKHCPKCNILHEKPGVYCSRSCASSDRLWSKETNEKRAVKLKGISTGRTQSESQKKKVRQTWADKYNATPFDKLGPETRKRRILEEQNGVCNHCGISEWRGKLLVLEIEHRDGDTHNNARENLECICPNCHSQTDTWRGRNNKGRPISDTELLTAVHACDTISAALRSVGLPDKGNSHARARRLLREE